jgi:hypothetical protein
LVDSFTDIIRPFSEARGLRADVLRLQGEEVAIKIARLARQRLKEENVALRPVPTKILVPLLEKGSCENIDDDEMLNRWANLLAAASINLSVQPRFVGILGELAGSQAVWLEKIAFNHWKEVEYPYTDFADAPTRYSAYWGLNDFKKLTKVVFRGDRSCESATAVLVDRLTGPGCWPELVSVIDKDKGEDCTWDCVQEGRGVSYPDMHVLESLNLISRVFIDIPLQAPRKFRVEATLIYWHLTALGVDFCQVCARPQVEQLKRHVLRRGEAT